MKDKIIKILLDGALSWFKKDVTTPFGNNKLKIKADLEVLSIVANYFSQIQFKDANFEKRKIILLLFIDDEINILSSWIHPLSGVGASSKFIVIINLMIRYLEMLI